MKASVWALPSLRLGKLRLNDVMIELLWPDSTSDRAHWPMQGPQALASTVAPTACRSASSPSRSTVARTDSDPGVTSRGVRVRRPRAEAWRATLAARLMSSYDELVHEPTSAWERTSGQPSLRASSPRAD